MTSSRTWGPTPGSVSRYYRVIGVDPSLTATAVADERGVDLISGDAKHGDRRLVMIHDRVDRAAGFNVDGLLVVIEALPGHQPGAASVGMAQGAIRLLFQLRGVTYAAVNSATLKKFATGSGRATKADMRMAWYKRTGQDIRDDNEVDALWLRQAGLHAIGHHEAVKLPRAQREALAKVKWPEDIADAVTAAVVAS